MEIKLSSSPIKSRGFTTAISDLGTKENYILIPECKEEYPLSDNIIVISLPEFIRRIRSKK